MLMLKQYYKFYKKKHKTTCCGGKKELELTSEQSAFNIPARKPTTNQCIIETT